MQLLNDTPFQVAWLPWQLEPRQHRLTLVVKATFKLVPGGTAAVAPVQLPPSGDEDYPDVEDPLTSVRYASDLVPFKPRADLLLVGHCHAPGGKPVPACAATVTFGAVKKTVAVIGNRTWKERLVGATPSDPEPFVSLPLRYENSYGGRRFKRNPIGKGQERAESGDRPLPNIEDPRAPIGAPADKPDPVGFGPLGMLWAERWDKVGTYRGKWFPERWPCFPDDFDWSHFNAAPADQQVEGFLKGDEALGFENLHPRQSAYRTRLPGLVARCFLTEPAAAGGGRPVLREVPMKADTLWVDMDRELAVLVWRGVAEVASAKADTTAQLFVAAEPLAGPRQSPLVYAARIKELQTPAAEPEPPAEPPEPEIPQADPDAQAAKAEQDVRAFIQRTGRDPDAVMAQAKADGDRKTRELCSREGIELPAETAITRDELLAKVQRKEPLAGLDLAGLDLSGVCLKGVDLQGVQLASANLRGADLSGANLDGVDLSGATLSGTNLERTSLKGADLTAANLDSARLGGASLVDAFCERASFVCADLKGAKAPGTDFTKANLGQASLLGADLGGAVLSGVLLDGADLREATLSGAVLEGARGTGVRADRANLTAAQAAGCELPGGVFGAIRGADSIWENAVLTGADFTASRMEGADFTGANLERARLNVANIPTGKFPGANLRAAEMKSSNLFMGSLLQADLTGADLRGSNLYAVEFTDAITDGLQLEFANLKQTRMAT